MQSSRRVKRRADHRDWALFTSMVLLVSVVSRLARDELDTLITAGTNHDCALDRLRRARSSLAGLDTIIDHFNQGDCP